MTGAIAMPHVSSPACASFVVPRYYANWYAPRPESFREDAELAREVAGTSDPQDAAARQLYLELASGAESGWDYSSRWFADGANLSAIRTTQVGMGCVGAGGGLDFWTVAAWQHSQQLLRRPPTPGPGSPLPPISLFLHFQSRVQMQEEVSALLS